MKETLQRIPAPLIVVAALIILALAGYTIFQRVADDQSGVYNVPMDRQRYMEEMKRQAGGGQAPQSGASSYRTSGQPGGAKP